MKQFISYNARFKLPLRYIIYTKITMTLFSTIIVPLLDYYKVILRKTLSPKDACTKIRQMKLSHKQIKNAEDVTLYKIISNVIEDIENSQNLNSHLGAFDLMQHMKNILSQYQIENNQVINLKQKASRAIMEAIQLIRFPCINGSAKKMDTCIKLVNKYGTQEQQNMLHSILRKKASR